MIAYKCRYIVVHGNKLMIKHTAGVRRELCDQFIATRNGNPQWSTNVSVCTVRGIEPHDVGSAGIFADEFSDRNHQECTKQA